MKRKPDSPHARRVKKLKRKNPRDAIRARRDQRKGLMPMSAPVEIDQFIARALLHMAVDAFFPMIYGGLKDSKVDAEFSPDETATDPKDTIE